MKMNNVNEEKPYIVLKPRAVVAIFPALIGNLLIIGLPLVFVVSYLLSTTSIVGQAVFSSTITTISFFLFVIFVIILLPPLFSYKNVKSREYRFFGDRIEFYEGFLNIDRKVVRYDRVTNVGFRKTIWDRLFGTGTIFLDTAGSFISEINIGYITNSERVYEEVQRLVKRHSDSGDGTESYGHRRHRQ